MPGVRELIFMHVDTDGDYREDVSGHGQKSTYIHHICKNQAMWLHSTFHESGSQSDGTPFHTPFPMLSRKGKGMQFMPAALQQTLEPLPVRTCIERFYDGCVNGQKLAGLVIHRAMKLLKPSIILVQGVELFGGLPKEISVGRGYYKKTEVNSFANFCFLFDVPLVNEK